MIFAAITLWIAWALMPDGATNDPGQILKVVGLHRERVWWSAIVQLMSCAAFAPAVLHLGSRGGRTAFAGGSLLLIGAMGMAADAVYHQAAYQFAAPDLEAAAVLPALARMQGEDIRSLVPLLLCMFVGAPLLAHGRARAGLGSRWATRLMLLAVAGALFGALAVNLAGLSRRIVVLGFFALFGAGLAVLGAGGWRDEVRG